jgi:iron complex outermembrane receptor protein
MQALAVVAPLTALCSAIAFAAQDNAASAPPSSREAAVETPQPTSDQKEAEEERQAKEEKKEEAALPVTKAVVKGEALEDTKQEGYYEAIKNVAGVSPANSKGTPNDSVNIRGIKLNLFSNYRLNGGLSTAGVLTVPTEDKEKIETLKGANALMFGIASPAGILNLITKRAGPVDITNVGLLGNTFGQLGVSFDVGRRFFSGKPVGVRMNASAARLENGVRNTTGDGEFVSLGLDWKATSRLTLVGDFEYFAKHVPDQAGISLADAVDGKIPITKVPDPRNFLAGPWARGKADTENFQIRGDYAFSDGLKVLAEVGRSYAYKDRFTTRISGYDLDTGAGGLVRVTHARQNFLNTFERVELHASFPTWFLAHNLTVGVSRAGRNTDTFYQANVNLPQRQNIYDPVELPAPVFTDSSSLPKQTSTETGVYAYETITVIPQVRLLAGLRFTWDTEDQGRVAPTTTKVWTPSFGALWDILPNLTVFGSYMEGLEAGATAPTNAVNAFQIMPAAVSTQKEIGIRYSPLRRLAFSMSAFEIERANAITDPQTLIFAQNGQINYKGIESTITYEVARPLSVGAAGQWLRAIQVSPNDPTIDGRHPENTPSVLGNVWVSIRPPFVPGLTLNAGASAIAERWINPQNQGTIPGYTLFTAGLGYQVRWPTGRAIFLVNADNLTNIRVWNSVQTGTYGTGMDRSIKMSARFEL